MNLNKSNINTKKNLIENTYSLMIACSKANLKNNKLNPEYANKNSMYGHYEAILEELGLDIKETEKTGSIKMLPSNCEIPSEVSQAGRIAARTIIKEATKDPDFSTGGSPAFYSIQKWKERKEEYGTESELIILHDGGDLAKYFSYDYECYSLIEKMEKSLKKEGLYTEQCTTWYSAIYKI